ncbi:MAG: creatininase family protein [Gemmatimonadetes bacterium]|nr:creatininase family protein [Gemmatimonadota bacterium]
MPPSTNAPNAARLDRLTWPEAAAWFRRDPRLLLPVGTCLQHGPHLPLGADTIVVERLAEAVSEKTGILVAPTLAYGVTSDIERSYAGTAALERKTLHRVLNELVDSWERQGLEEIVLMTAHGYGPHIQAMAAVVADFVRVRAVDIHAIDLEAFLRGGQEAEHAGELDTAILLHLAPELVREDRVVDDGPGEGIRRAVKDEPVPPMGSPGVVGRPSLATRDSGRRICEYLVDYISRRLDA